MYANDFGGKKDQYKEVRSLNKSIYSPDSNINFKINVIILCSENIVINF